MPFTKAQLAKIGAEIRKANRLALKGLRSGEDQAVKEILKLLKQMNDDLKASLLDLKPSEFKASQLKRLQVMIDTAIMDFKDRASQAMAKHAKSSVEISRAFWIDQMDALRKIDKFVPAVMPVISDEGLSVISTLSVEVVKGLADDTAKKLKLELQKAVMGNQTPYDAAQAVSEIVGPRGNIGASAAAERIVRTEVNRAYNLTDELFRQQSLEQRPEDAPPIVKIWVAAPDDRVRASHEKVDHLYVYADDEFKVPIAGKKGVLTDRFELMTGPHDPKASAANVVNCRCTTYTVPEYLASDFDAKPQS